MSFFSGVTDFVKDVVCQGLELVDLAGAIAGVPEGELIRNTDQGELARSIACNLPPRPEAERAGVSPAEFDQGVGWYAFCTGLDYDIFSCTDGPAYTERSKSFFGDAFSSVSKLYDRRRQNGPCEWTYGYQLALIRRSDGGQQEGSIDNPGGPNNKATGLDIFYWNGAEAGKVRGPVSVDDRTFSGDITVPGGSGVDVTVPIVGVLGVLKVDINGNVVIPVTVNVGGITFQANYNVSKDEVSLNPSSNTQDGRPFESPTDWDALDGVTIPDPLSGTPEPSLADDLSDQISENRRPVVAALVTVTASTGSVGILGQGDNPDIGIPDYGNISFLCRVGNDDYGWTQDLQVKNARNLIQCPIDAGAIGVKGTPRPGVVWTITPIYSKKRI